MLVVSCITWWYTAGWLKVVAAVWRRAEATLRFFSVSQLLGSLFAPFKQISAGRVQSASLKAELQAWGDKQFSRFMGAIIRSILIIFGLLLASVVFAFGIILVCLWPLLPVAPVAGLLLASVGYAP